MHKTKLIAIKSETKKQLDELKLCNDESYNSMLKRILPEWAIILKNKLNEEEAKAPSTIQDEQTKDSL